jgi:hypothetical protein
VYTGERRIILTRILNIVAREDFDWIKLCQDRAYSFLNTLMNLPGS